MQKYQQRAYGLVTIKGKSYPYLVTEYNGDYTYRRISNAPSKVITCYDEDFKEAIENSEVANHFLANKPITLKRGTE